MIGLSLVNWVPPMSTIVNVHEAKTHLSRLLADVAAGAEVVIAKAGKPVARLVPVEAGPRPKRLGLLRGRIKVPADFNAPLSAADLADFEGR
jgi:prevent-host-death family protein